MGLISGILTGIIIGIGIIYGWCQMMQHRSKKRIEKAVDMKLLGSLGRDELKKLCGDNFPEWVSFPVYEPVKWLNKQLTKMWPFIADAATAVIKESVEPILEEYRPPGITALKFSKLSLGNVPPKIEGIRVQSLKQGQITMDVDFRWGGDPDIVLGIEAAMLASLPIQLKDLQVFTVIRVIFQLSEEIPCISAVVIALLSEPKPRFDYILKAVGGSLSAVPGLSDMIDDTVSSIITDMLEWPHRIVVPLGGVAVDISDLELKPQGKLTVTVVKANDLKNMEMLGKSDPYTVLFVRTLFKVKTKVIDNNLNPNWNETFDLIVEDMETQALMLEVFDQDIGQDKRLGVAKIPLIDLEVEGTKEIQVRLLSSLDTLKVKDKKDRGTITIESTYYKFNKEEQLAALAEEKKILEERNKLKEEGVIGSTMEAVDGAVSIVGSGVEVVGSGLAVGAGAVGTGISAGAGVVTVGAGAVGSGLAVGAGAVGTGLSTGAGIMGSGFGAVGGSLSKAGRFMGRTFAGQSGRKSGSTTPVEFELEAGGGAKARVSTSTPPT
ncbi:calcium-dependent lipid-binding protein-like [Impatiens glandulifera]|uniref:calcium-dependent lipid-binding protein-like n=1 Tax=Impatiens glandulifera TaxID=253017 RepID=UPI001FB152F1|nr:calcium-dependent lipid-binding protein-like [Impatiens glandulifera]